METELKQNESKPNELLTFLSSSGLVEAKRNDIAQSLGMFFDKASEWNQTINSIVITDPSETGKMKMAKEGRLTLKNMRLDAQKVVDSKRQAVKNRMADDVLEDKLLLKAGQMVEATFKNLEGKLEEKEKFAERWEAENKAKLKIARDTEVLPYAEFVLGGIDLSNLNEADYQKFISVLKLQMESKLENEAKIKAEKEAKEKVEREERERIALENARLKAEAIEAEKKRLAEKAEADRILKAEQEANAKEIAEQKAKADAEAKRLKAESDAKLKSEKEKAELEAKEAKKIADAKAKELADAKAIADAENAKLRAEKAKSDAEIKAKAEADAIEAKKKEGQAHKSKILGEAKQSFIDNGYSEDDAKKIVLLINGLKIKNVSVNF
jgi:hypothetical protein